MIKTFWIYIIILLSSVFFSCASTQEIKQQSANTVKSSTAVLMNGKYDLASFLNWLSKNYDNSSTIYSVVISQNESLALLMEKKGNDWYLNTYVQDQKVEGIEVFSKEKYTLLDWNNNHRVKIIRKAVNPNNHKAYELRDDYTIDREGKFHKIIR